MPSQKAHLDQALHNEKFIDHLNYRTTQFRDWATTGAFYAALHYIDAYLAIKDIHPDYHSGDGSRDTYVKKHLSNCWNPYRKLKTSSESARYSASFNMPPGEISTEVLGSLKFIKNRVAEKIQ